MSENFTVEIISPDNSIIETEASEVVIPSYEGEMGILKNHVSIISFLKPGIVRVFEGSNEENYYVDDGILEFKNNCLSILTSNIFDVKKVDKNVLKDTLSKAEQDSQKNDVSDQKKYLLDQKIEVLRSLNLN
mgnify:CR=1 FL=1